MKNKRIFGFLLIVVGGMFMANVTGCATGGDTATSYDFSIEGASNTVVAEVRENNLTIDCIEVPAGLLKTPAEVYAGASSVSDGSLKVFEITLRGSGMTMDLMNNARDRGVILYANTAGSFSYSSITFTLEKGWNWLNPSTENWVLLDQNKNPASDFNWVVFNSNGRELWKGKAQ